MMIFRSGNEEVDLLDDYLGTTAVSAIRFDNTEEFRSLRSRRRQDQTS